MGASNSVPETPPFDPVSGSTYERSALVNQQVPLRSTLANACHVTIEQWEFNFVSMCIMDCDTGILQEFRTDGLTELNETQGRLVLCLLLWGKGGYALFIDSLTAPDSPVYEAAVVTELIMNRTNHTQYKRFVSAKLKFIKQHYASQYAKWSAQYTLFDCDAHNVLDWDNDLSTYNTEQLDDDIGYRCGPMGILGGWKS